MSDINCDCGYNYTQTGCPNCKHIPIDYTQEYEQALANMQREYDKRGDRIEELEEQLKTILDRETSILRYYDAKLDAAEAKLASLVPALSYEGLRTDEAEAKLTIAMVGLVQSRDELDLYSQHEYPSDHPVHERCRKRDYDANPARIAIAKIKGEQL